MTSPTGQTCAWTMDAWDEDSVYETACGQTFMLTDPTTLAEHGFKFCVYCGRPVEEVRTDRFAEVSDE